MEDAEFKKIVADAVAEAIKPEKEKVLESFHAEVKEARGMRGLRRLKDKYLEANPELTREDLDISPKGSVKNREGGLDGKHIR